MFTFLLIPPSSLAPKGNTQKGRRRDGSDKENGKKKTTFF
jgi:hypothetical protein